MGAASMLLLFLTVAGFAILGSTLGSKVAALGHEPCTMGCPVGADCRDDFDCGGCPCMEGACDNPATQDRR